MNAGIKAPQRLPSGSWRVQVRDPRDPRRRKSFTAPTMGEVMAAAETWRRLRRELAAGLITREDMHAKIRLSERGGALTVEEVWTSYVASFAPVRQRALKSHWNTHFKIKFGGLLAQELTAIVWGEWERWEGGRKTRKGTDTSKSTVSTLFALMRAAYGRRVDAGELQKLPWGKWKPTGQFGRPAQEREALRSVEEVLLVLGAARAHDDKLRAWGHYSDLQARMGAMLLHGLRQGEAGGAGWDDYRALNGVRVLGVNRQVRDGWATDNAGWERPLDEPKARSSGNVVCHPVLVRLLDDLQIYQRSRGLYRPTGPIFPARHGGWRKSRTTVEPALFRDMLRAAGLDVLGVDVDRFVTHSARHTFGTLEALHSSDIKATGERIRHSDAAVTTMYMHRAGRDLPGSAIPDFAVTLPNNVQVLPAGDEHDEHDALELARVLRDAGPTTPADELEAADAETRADAGAFEAVYRRWVEGGRSGPRPAEVTAEAERARSRAWKRVTAAGGTKEAAQRAGRTARRAYLGAWGKFKARKEGSSAQAKPPVKGQLRARPAGEVAEVIPLRRKAGT